MTTSNVYSRAFYQCVHDWRPFPFIRFNDDEHLSMFHCVKCNLVEGTLGVRGGPWK